MKFSFNTQSVLSAVRTKLLNDATLLSASYLNGANKIFTGRLPNDYLTPAILVSNSTPFYIDDGNLFSGEVRVFSYCNLLANGQTDLRNDRIILRCEELLSNETLDVSGMSCQPIQSLGWIHLVDTETDGNKSKGILRLRISIGYNNI